MSQYDVFGQTGGMNWNTSKGYEQYGTGAKQYSSSLADQLGVGIPIRDKWGRIEVYPSEYRQWQNAPQESAQKASSSLAAQNAAAELERQRQAQQGSLEQQRLEQQGSMQLSSQQEAAQMAQLQASMGGQSTLQQALLASQEQQKKSELANALEQISLKTSGESELLGKKASLTNEMVTKYWNMLSPYLESFGVTPGGTAGSITGQQPLSYNYSPLPGELAGLEETYSQGRRAAIGSSRGRERGRALAEALQAKMLGLTNLQATGRQTAANAALTARGQNLGLLSNLLSGLKPSISF